MSENVKTVPCPTCQSPAIWSKNNAYRPFCSKRCKLIDLGEWANENHRIEGKPAVNPVDDTLYPITDDSDNPHS